MAKNQIGGGQISSIAIAVAVLLLIILAWYYYSVYKDYKNKKNDATWPPNGYNACPDYWIKNGNLCINAYGVGLPDCTFPHGLTTAQNPLNPSETVQALNLNNEYLKSSNGQSNFNKCQFSRECEAPWEGIDTLCA